MDTKTLQRSLDPSGPIKWLGRNREHQPRKASHGDLWLSLVIVAIFGCAAAVFIGAVPLSNSAGESMSDISGVYHGQQPPYARTPWGNDQINLINQEYAADPTWEQLAAFLITDKTDQKSYDPLSFPCGAFAEELHNNAETQGIRSAWVVVEFEGDSQRHSLNAFLTTDKGLVWVDITESWFESLPQARQMLGNEDMGDKVAYLEIGKQYGLVSLSTALSPEYDYYEEYMRGKLEHRATSDLYYQMTEAYMSETARYDEWLSREAGQVVFAGAPVGKEVHDWYDQLDEEANELNRLAISLDEERESLGPYWGSLGTVTNIAVYW